MSFLKRMNHYLTGQKEQEKELKPVVMPRTKPRDIASEYQVSQAPPTPPSIAPAPAPTPVPQEPSPEPASALPAIPSFSPSSKLPAAPKPPSSLTPVASSNSTPRPSAAIAQASGSSDGLDEEILAKIRQRYEKCGNYDPKLAENPDNGTWVLIDRKTDKVYAEFKDRDDAVFHARAREYTQMLFDEVERLRRTVADDIKRLEEYIAKHRAS